MSTSRSPARRPRRPGDARHDPIAIDESEVLDDHRDRAAPGRASPLPALCQDVLLLRGRTDCPKCSQRTAAFAMIGLPEFETHGRGTVMLRRLAAVSPALQQAMRAFAGQLWRVDQSRAVKGSHWHSHCERCGARLGEAFLHGPQGPFRPRLYKERAAIKAKRIEGPVVFDGAATVLHPSMADWLAWCREREDQQRASDRPRRAPSRPAKSAASRG